MNKIAENLMPVKTGPAFTDDPVFMAQMVILASMIEDCSLIPDINERVAGVDFYRKALGGLYGLILGLYDREGHVDLVSASTELMGNKSLNDEIGGPAALSELVDMHAATPSVVKRQCDVVKKAAEKRTIAKALGQAQAGLKDGRVSPSRIIKELRENLSSESSDVICNEPGFGFTPISEYMSGDLQPPEWRIKDILEDKSLAVLFGPAESFKSFLALDWGLSVAAQISWSGHFVSGGPVFSIIGEGENGYRRRIAAWLKANNVSRDFPFFVSDVPAQILNVESAQAVGNAINELRAEYGKPALVIIDTLARNFGPGHENDTKDMTTFISHLDKYVGRDFARLIVHHSGLTDQNRSRGNSALRAALDAEYKMSSREGEITLCCTKMKDAPKFPPFHFMPKVIALGGTEHDPITSVVLSRVEGQQEIIRLTTQWRDALNLLHEMCGEKVSELLPEWRKALCEKKIYTRGASYSACDTLSDKGLIVISGDYVRLSELSERVLFDLPGQGVDVSVLSSPLRRGGQSDTPRTKQQTTVII